MQAGAARRKSRNNRPETPEMKKTDGDKNSRKGKNKINLKNFEIFFKKKLKDAGQNIVVKPDACNTNRAR